jgi:hypothetical protein
MNRLFLFLIAVSLTACSKIPIHESLRLPLFDTPTITEISPSGVTFSAFVHQTGAVPILRSSFNWYPVDQFFEIENDRFKIDVDLRDQQEASARLDRDLIPNMKYALRLIIELENQKIYSDTVHFDSQGATFMPIREPKITSEGGGFGLPGLNNEWLLFRSSPDNFSQSQLFSFDPAQEDWVRIDQNYPSFIVNDYFQTVDNQIFSLGKEMPFNSASDYGIWTMDDYTTGFDQFDALPSPGPFRNNFGFTINGETYAPTRDWELARFELGNFQGTTILGDIPFPNNTYQYHSTVAQDKGYIFFSDPDFFTGSIIHSHQFWVFSPASNTWQRLADFPGTGKDKFAFVSDGNRYIYVGLGTVGRNDNSTDNRIQAGDLWQYDIETDQWAFMGWVTKRGAHYRNFATVANTSSPYLLFGNFDVFKSVVVRLVPEDLRPF